MQHLAWTTVRGTASTPGPQFLSAYYDHRAAVPGRPAVVVLGYQLKAVSNMTLYCLLTFSSQKTLCQQAPATKYIIHWNIYLRNKQSEPMEYVCHWTEQNIPTMVALSPSPNCANASESIPVHNRSLVGNKTRHDFAVCVQSPIFKKSSAKIAEFIEMQLALGTHHVTMYYMDVDIIDKFEQLSKYSENGQLVLVKWQSIELHYYGELLVMHDCLYRNMYAAKYLVFVDMDELILPIQHNNWTSMMKEIDTSPKIGAFVFLNTYFTNNPNSIVPTKPCKELDIPVYFKWTKRYLCRYTRHRRSKYIVKPRIATELGIHGIGKLLNGRSEITVPSTIGINAHYRFRRSSDCRNTATVVDTTALRYQSQVMDSLQQIMCRPQTY